MTHTAQLVRGKAIQSAGHWRLASGCCVTIRPMRPRDADAVQAYVRGLSTEARYNRFFGALTELPAGELDRLTRMDQLDRLALVVEAVTKGRSMVIAEARYAVTEATTGEFALSVADAFRRQGVGALLLSVLECRARTLGARQLTGDVLRTNRAMLSLARTAGFGLAGASDDPRVVRVGKDVSVLGGSAPCRDLAITPPYAA